MTDYEHTMHEAGYIYAIGYAHRPHVKIGKTTRELAKRLREHHIHPNQRVHVIASVHVTQDLSVIERQIHTILAKLRIGHTEEFAWSVDQQKLDALVAQAVSEIAVWRELRRTRHIERISKRMLKDDKHRYSK